MSSQSVDINNKKIIALTNTSKYNSFIFDVELDISYTAYSAWESSAIDFFYQALSKTIACQIGHKYKQWEVSSDIIARRLYDEFSLLQLSGKKWECIISVAGQYHDPDSVSADFSEMIYDCFTYDGCLTKPNDISEMLNIPDAFLQYTIRFVLSPALPSAQPLYFTRGYQKIPKCIPYLWINYSQKDVIKKIDQKKEYNHLVVWQAVIKHFFH
ncbi:hypothetical protein PV326_010014 [Microctonus aethiopoides]|nr:hypothetical protein PV326_010014 [Microctonus aethiopoides]